MEKKYDLIDKEHQVMEPLVVEGLVSKVEYYKLLREATHLKEELESVKLSIPQINSAIEEYKNRLQEEKNNFYNLAQKEYNDLKNKYEQIQQENRAFEDQVERTSVVAPVSGYIKKLYINTIGGVVQLGMDLVEIVPTEEKLLLEAKIKPADIGFLYLGQKATVKITAYDFAIYGALDGVITKISPDTTIDKQQNTYYLVYIETDKNYLGMAENPLKIIPGMKASADILTGKKTVFEYLLKPIFKTKTYALTEH